MRSVILAVLLLCTNAASADETLSQLSGRVSDKTTGNPVEGALVLVSGSGGLKHTLTTDREGRYGVDIAPGEYILVFVYGTARSSGRVTIAEGRGGSLDGKLDATEGEVIVIREKLKPPVLPKAKNHKPMKAPPYSDRAILSDAWTKAWLLLDVNETGDVTRMKFLKRPGYDLEQIAQSEVFKLKFDPAKDMFGKPIRSWVVWSIEWPSAWWLEKLVGTRSGMPPIVGFPGHRLDDYVPCEGSGPWHMGSMHKTYKDCSKPDLKKAATEAWIAP